jgi:non-ribosomal peptide synthetase component F
LKEFLTQVRNTTLAAQANQHLPFEHLVRFLERKRKISRRSLFQVMFIYHNMELETFATKGLIFTPAANFSNRAESKRTVTTCDLILLLKETAKGLVGSLTFKRDTFDSKRARDLRRSFFRILETLMKNPENSVGWVCSRARESKH